MNIIPWDPWEELARVRQRTEQMWDEFLGSINNELSETVAFVPSADVVESPTEYRLFVAVPGFVEEDIAINLENERTLAIRGERLPHYDENRATHHVKELRYGYFERQFLLSAAVDAETLRASYDAGMLTIVIGKSNSDATNAGGTTP